VEEGCRRGHHGEGLWAAAAVMCVLSAVRERTDVRKERRRKERRKRKGRKRKKKKKWKNFKNFGEKKTIYEVGKNYFCTRNKPNYN
jgi:hypothetical protein